MMKHRSQHMLQVIVVVAIAAIALLSCRRVPLLHQHDHTGVVTKFPMVDLNLNILWNYTQDYGWDYDWHYDWKSEWIYGWDSTDIRNWGEIGYPEPTKFHIRRYYTNWEPFSRHTIPPVPEIVEGRTFKAHYEFGYYDILVWNHAETLDGVVALNFDEETTLDSVVAYTNPTRRIAHALPSRTMYAHWQPEGLICDYSRAVYISHDPKDYDRYDPEQDLYYMDIHMTLRPVTYIYLVQLILYNNNGKVDNAQGEADATGLARSTCLNSGYAGKDVVAVYFNTRMKRHLQKNAQQVDVVGGRFVTFGMCGLNPNLVTTREQAPSIDPERIISAQDIAAADPEPHFLNIPVYFNNGADSTFTFEVTEQLRRLYRGGVITVELDMDTVPIPHHGGGSSSFDAEVQPYDSVTYEIPM